MGDLVVVSDKIPEKHQQTFKSSLKKSQGPWNNNCGINSITSEFVHFLLRGELDSFLGSEHYSNLLEHFKKYYDITDSNFHWGHLKKMLTDMNRDEVEYFLAPVFRSFLPIACDTEQYKDIMRILLINALNDPQEEDSDAQQELIRAWSQTEPPAENSDALLAEFLAAFPSQTDPIVELQAEDYNIAHIISQDWVAQRLKTIAHGSEQVLWHDIANLAKYFGFETSVEMSKGEDSVRFSGSIAALQLTNRGKTFGHYETFARTAAEAKAHNANKAPKYGISKEKSFWQQKTQDAAKETIAPIAVPSEEEATAILAALEMTPSQIEGLKKVATDGKSPLHVLIDDREKIPSEYAFLREELPEDLQGKVQESLTLAIEQELVAFCQDIWQYDEPFAAGFLSKYKRDLLTQKTHPNVNPMNPVKGDIREAFLGSGVFIQKCMQMASKNLLQEAELSDEQLISALTKSLLTLQEQILNHDSCEKKLDRFFHIDSEAFDIKTICNKAHTAISVARSSPEIVPLTIDKKDVSIIYSLGGNLHPTIQQQIEKRLATTDKKSKKTGSSPTATTLGQFHSRPAPRLHEQAGSREGKDIPSSSRAIQPTPPVPAKADPEQLIKATTYQRKEVFSPTVAAIAKDSNPEHSPTSQEISSRDEPVASSNPLEKISFISPNESVPSPLAAELAKQQSKRFKDNLRRHPSGEKQSVHRDLTAGYQRCCAKGKHGWSAPKNKEDSLSRQLGIAARQKIWQKAEVSGNLEAGQPLLVGTHTKTNLVTIAANTSNQVTVALNSENAEETDTALFLSAKGIREAAGQYNRSKITISAGTFDDGTIKWEETLRLFASSAGVNTKHGATVVLDNEDKAELIAACGNDIVTKLQDLAEVASSENPSLAASAQQDLLKIACMENSELQNLAKPPKPHI